MGVKCTFLCSSVLVAHLFLFKVFIVITDISKAALKPHQHTQRNQKVKLEERRVSVMLKASSALEELSFVLPDRSSVYIICFIIIMATVHF